MEVHFTPDVQAKLEQMARESSRSAAAVTIIALRDRQTGRTYPGNASNPAGIQG